MSLIVIVAGSISLDDVINIRFTLGDNFFNHLLLWGHLSRVARDTDEDTV